MTTIGKPAHEIESPVVPRGIVHQRKAFFASEKTISLPTFSTPIELPSTSVVHNRRDSLNGRDVVYSDQRRNVHIQVTQMRAPADLVRRSPDDDVSNLQRRVVLVRQPANQEPRITVSEVRSAESRQTHYTNNRIFPIVTVNVGEQDHFNVESNPPSFAAPPASRISPLSTSWQARPPSVSLFRHPGTGPVHKQTMPTFTSTPISKNIQSIEGTDTVSYKKPIEPLPDYRKEPFESSSYSPKPPDNPPPLRIVRKNIARPLSLDIQHLEKQTALKLDDLYRREDDLIEEREEELARAKDAIKKLSKDLERLEQDRKHIGDGTIIEEEEIDIDYGENENKKKKKEKEREERVRVDAEEILRECNRMMVKLKEEEEADVMLLEKIQRGETSEEEIQKEILRLQRQVAELNAMGVELPPLRAKQNTARPQEDTSQIVSVKDQAVMFSTGGNSRQEALISRLERELTDAQTCNHRLNAQLGNLANNNESTLKKEFLGLQKTLKERNEELDQLRKKVQKAEKDRQQWDQQKKQLESKLPVDVQLLLAQKKELTTQLDREQSEKQELFMQMNTLIAQLADCGDADTLKEEVTQVQKKYRDLQERQALLEQDLARARTDAEVARRNYEAEKRQLQSDADDARKELNMKAAALQSLMLAKQDNTKLEMLTEENKRMQASVEELQTNLRDAQVLMAQQLTNKLDQYHTNSSNAAQEELQRRLEDMESRLKHAQERSDNIEAEKKHLQESLNAKNREIANIIEQLRDAQQENELSAAKHNAAIVQLQSELNDIRRGGDDDSRRLQEKEKILQATLDETSAKLDATKVALLSAESRAVQAESDLKSLDAKALNAERRVLQLQEQLSAAGNEEKEMELLRDQLRKAEDRHETLLTKHQKTESLGQESANTYRMQLEELQQRLERSERDHRQVMEKQNKSEDSEKHTSQRISQLEMLKSEIESERDELDEKVQSLKKELAQVRLDKQSQKSSVAEEITTLTNVTASLRNENSQYQEQLAEMERGIHDLKSELEEKEYENEQLIKELEQARDMADSERQTLTLLKSTQQQEEEKASKVHVELAQEREARKKAEMELAAKFGAELEEVSRERTKVREEKSRLENELIDLRRDHSKLEEEHASLKSRSMEDEVRLRAETSRMQTNYSIMEDSKKELEEQLRQATHAKEELEGLMEKKLREAKEATEAVKREVESQKIRVRELEEERTRELGTNDEEKTRLLEELRFYREKADAQELEVATLKTKVVSASQEADTSQAKAGLLQTRLENLQAECDEMKQVLHSTEESAEKMRESEQMAAKIKKQLEEIENEHREKLREESTKREELERKIDELTSHSKQQEMMLLTSSDGQKAELESALQKNTELEARLSQSAKAQNELLQNVKNLTALVESESKRIEETAAEKRRWQAKAEDLERQMEHTHSEEMNRLVTENARLAGELLTLRSQLAEAHHYGNSKDLEAELSSLRHENQRLTSELDNVRSRTEDLNRSIVQADRKKRDEVQSVQKQLEMERQERERLQERIDNMYQNGHPTAPPRTLSNMSAITSMTTQDFTEIDDVDQLHKMMDKQQRIIKVLRRKLLKLEQQ